MSIDGNDDCNQSVAVRPPVHAPTISPNSNPDLIPSPPVDGPDAIYLDIQTFVQMYRGMADEILTYDQNNENFGSESNYVTVYSNPSDPPNLDGLSISSGTSYGLLLVEGDLTMGGGFRWNGLVLATGTITLNGGGGSKNIMGAIMGQQIVNINGNVNITHSSCEIRNALKNQPLQVISWRDTSIVDPLS
jgi:hypothetical protein